MLRGMNRLLRQGAPQINPDLSVSVLDDSGREIHRLPPSAVAHGGIGFVYERVVCIHYATLGYGVEHRAHLGFNDRGVDLVAEKPGEKIFVQCKFTLNPLSRQAIERLLYAASNYVKANLASCSNYFDLVVPFKDLAFRRPRTLMTFDRYNQSQRAIRLRIAEVPIAFPDTFDVGP